jgi:hypothetical protein
MNIDRIPQENWIALKGFRNLIGGLLENCSLWSLVLTALFG